MPEHAILWFMGTFRLSCVIKLPTKIDMSFTIYIPLYIPYKILQNYGMELSLKNLGVEPEKKKTKTNIHQCQATEIETKSISTSRSMHEQINCIYFSQTKQSSQ